MSVNVYNKNTDSLDPISGRVADGVRLKDVKTLAEIQSATSFTNAEVASASAVKESIDNNFKLVRNLERDVILVGGKTWQVLDSFTLDEGTYMFCLNCLSPRMITGQSEYFQLYVGTSDYSFSCMNTALTVANTPSAFNGDSMIACTSNVVKIDSPLNLIFEYRSAMGSGTDSRKQILNVYKIK